MHQTKQNQNNIKVNKQQQQKHNLKQNNKPTHKTIKILYTNANGISNKIKSLQTALQNYKPDICSLTETKLTTNPPNIKGYTWEFRNRTTKNGGGVAQLLADNITKYTNTTQNLDDHNQEIIWTQIKTGPTIIHMGTYYSPQESCTKEEIQRQYNQLSNQIQKLKQTGEIILTGDFNAKLKINNKKVNQNQSRNGRLLQNLINQHNLTPISTKANQGQWTRINRKNPNQKSIIDYIIISDSLNKYIKDIIIDEEGIYRIKGNNDSDHNTILLKLNLPLQRNQEKKTKWKTDDPLEWEQFNKLIQETAKNNPPQNYEQFTNLINHTLKKTITEEVIWITRNKPREARNIVDLRKQKKKAKAKYKQALKKPIKNNQTKTTLLEEYIKTRSDLKEQIQTNIEEFNTKNINQIIKQGGTQSKNFWKTRKQITTPKTTKYNLITEENEEITKPEVAMNYIADYYENLYQARESTPEYTQQTEKINNIIKTIENNMNNKPKPEEFTINELNQVIQKLKRNKSPGPDKIPNELFIEANQQTRLIYLEMFNQTLREEKIPKQWQHGSIITIYKGKGTKGKCSNQRGITLSSNIGKTMERLINNRLIKQVNITEAQAGGQKGKSTTDHLLILKDTIQHIKNQRKTAYIIFLDVTKAYDKAWIKAILLTLYKNGLKNRLWNMVLQLNQNLTAEIQTKYGTTRTITIKDSLRQGGVLAVILYATLMDEINKAITRSNIPPIIPNLQHETGCLLWVDDVVLIADSPQKAQRLLKVTDQVANMYHIEFGKEKSKILKNRDKKPTKPPTPTRQQPSPIYR